MGLRHETLPNLRLPLDTQRPVVLPQDNHSRGKADRERGRDEKGQGMQVMAAVKPKTCKMCREKFIPVRPLQTICGFHCAVALSVKNKAKEETEIARAARAAHREAKVRLKSRGEWLRDAQIAYNAWIRARDDGKPCVSCGSFTGKKNAGHYRSVGSAPELRFEPMNCHLQCEKCNSYLSGNLINYRIELIKRIGLDNVEWLEGHHEPKKYAIPDLKAIKAEYKLKLRELLRLQTA